MPPGFPAKFASTSLRLFRHEGSFEIDIPDGLDIEEVAQEYESYGHRVDRDARVRRLCIVCALPVARA